MKTNIISKTSIAIIVIIVGLIMPQNTQAQNPTPEVIKQQVKKSLGVSPQVSNAAIGHCPNCGGVLSSYTDIDTENNRRVIKDTGWKCNSCGRKYSKRHSCKTYTPEEFKRGIRRCILVERITIDDNSNMETLIISNYCITFNAFKCSILNGNSIVQDNIILKHGESFRKDLPRNCRIVARKMPAQRGDSNTGY